MGTLSLTTWLTGFTSASYDDVTGVISLTIDDGITTDENVIKGLILGLESSASGKRTNLNSPISEKLFPDSPQYSFVSRSNADNSSQEIQVEYQPQLSLWLKAIDPTTSDAVNDND